jgi:predicted RNA-binding Zn-ribbon protein involved in translation (DUF1610 family)
MLALIIFPAFAVSMKAGAEDRGHAAHSRCTSLGHAMTTKAAEFHCPNCNALYKVVRMEATSTAVDQEITCRRLRFRAAKAISFSSIFARDVRVTAGVGLERLIVTLDADLSLDCHPHDLPSFRLL